MQKIHFIFLALLFPFYSIAQNVPDSIFHNYLYDTRTLYFSQLPIKTGSIIFWGDSITHWGDWAELTGNANTINRGIAGDNTYGLLNRENEIIRHHPKKLFILIGTNDINIHILQNQIIKNYASIIRIMQKQSPATRIYIQSVLPINNQLIGRKYYTGTNEEIQLLNKSLDSLANASKTTFVDLYHSLTDNQNQLDSKFTYDGLHLNGNGYLIWINILKKKKFL